MSYYRYQRRRSWSYGGYSRPTEYDRLQRLFGGAVKDIKRAFLELDSGALSKLLTDYGERYGDAAERYARNTFSKWKSGRTNLSGQTMTRLIELVPPYLSSQQRFNLLQHVLERNPSPSKQNKAVRINVKEPEAGLNELDSAVASMRHSDLLAHLPERVMEAASWLYDKDITAARAMLAEAERRENEIILASASREIELLKRTIRTGQVKSAGYSVTMPAGKLSVVAFMPSKCFVATECFGAGSSEVETLRCWRDRTLMHNNAGQRFIIWYYHNGEEISRVVGSSMLLKVFLRGVLKALVYWLNSDAKAGQGECHGR